MLERMRIRWYRFAHGEDVFDAWPGDEPVAAERPAVRRVQPAKAQPSN